MRRGVEVDACNEFAEYIDTEICVQVALMADAADDGLLFLREMEERLDVAWDPASLSSDVMAFLLRIVIPGFARWWFRAAYPWSFWLEKDLDI